MNKAFLSLLICCIPHTHFAMVNPPSSKEIKLILQDHIQLPNGHMRLVYNPIDQHIHIRSYDSQLAAYSSDSYHIEYSDESKNLKKHLAVAKLCGLAQYKGHIVYAGIASAYNDNDTLFVGLHNPYKKNGDISYSMLKDTKEIKYTDVELSIRDTLLVATVLCQYKDPKAYFSKRLSLGMHIYDEDLG